MAIAVTGALGFVGSHFIGAFNRDHKIVAVTRGGTLDSRLVMAEGLVVVNCDLARDPGIFSVALDKYKVDTVVHFAAQPIVFSGENAVRESYLCNIMGSVNVLEAASRSNSVRKVILMSTDKVFGSQAGCFINTPYAVTGHYSASKIAMEYIAEAFKERLHIIMPRFCNIYGFDPNNVTRIIPATVYSLVGENRPIIYVPEGTRQYIYIYDVMKYFKAMLEMDYSCVNIVRKFNIGSDNVFKSSEIVGKIVKIMGVEGEPFSEPMHFSSREREIAEQSLATVFPVKIETTPFDEGLKKTVEELSKYWKRSWFV